LSHFALFEATRAGIKYIPEARSDGITPGDDSQPLTFIVELLERKING